MAPIFAFWGTCKRGAATAVYDYANYGERLLGLSRPLIICSNSLNGDDASLKLNLKRLRAAPTDEVETAGIGRRD